MSTILSFWRGASIKSKKNVVNCQEKWLVRVFRDFQGFYEFSRRFWTVFPDVSTARQESAKFLPENRKILAVLA